MSECDLVVVGAGPSGLIAAHTWLTLQPQSRVIIFEAGSAVGGAWSKDRVYPTMMTQTPFGMLEFSCYPMSPPEETFYDLFSGDHAYRYLESFSQTTKFAGKTLKERIHFDSKVVQIRKSGHLWVVLTSTNVEVRGRNLIMATGPTSIPSMPSFGRKTASIPVLHSRELAKNSNLLASSVIQNVVVIGGSKSAFDAVYFLAKAGKTIHWVIRPGGQGPGVLATPDGGGLFKNSHEIMSLKLIAKTSPCIFEPVDGWTRFFHRWPVGRWIVKTLWGVVNAMWQTRAKYQRNENFARLKPERSVYWCSDNLGVQNTVDLWDVISNRATVIRDEVIKIEEEGSAILASGGKIKCDALVACTGWDISYPMFTKEDTIELGLPIPATDVPLSVKIHWDAAVATADDKIVERFPALASIAGSVNHKMSPNHFYRSIIPLQDPHRSIAFLGQIGTSQSFTVAEIQSLWAIAYLTDQLTLPTTPKMEEDVAMRIAWRRRRYLADGHTMLYDQIAYQSMLVRDLGLNDLRKGGGWRELLRPYCPRDYKGLVDEWLESRRKADDKL